MPKSIPLSRPLVFLAIQSTGPDVVRDRIVEIGLIKLHPDGRQEEWQHLIHPGRAIPEAATAVHGIDDSKVADEPSFAELAPEILRFLGQADLCGFGISRLDLPMLEQEFRRCGQFLSLAQRGQVDLLKIYQRLQPRDLPAAVRDYLQREHQEAHSARQDALACVDLLEAMLLRHDRLAQELPLRSRPTQPAEAISCSKVAFYHGQPHLTFGLYSQRSLSDVAREDPGYLRWILTQTFPENFKQLVREALPSPDDDLSDSSFYYGENFK